MQKQRYISMRGNQIPEELYEDIIKFDQKIFVNGSDEYVTDTAVSPEIIREFLPKSIPMTNLIYDLKTRSIIALFIAVSIDSQFITKILNCDYNFQDLNAKYIEDFDKSDVNLYIFNISILPEYRSVPLSDSHESTLNGRKLLQVLLENFALSVIDLAKKGTKVDTIFYEAVSKKGNILSSDLTNHRLLHEEEDTGVRLYGNKFDFNVFNKLPGFNKLNAEYLNALSSKCCDRE